MNDTSEELPNIAYWSEILRPVFQGKKIIVVGELIAILLPRARQFKELGAESTFMLATEGVGTGEVPTEEDGEWIALDVPAASDIVEALHAGNAMLNDLPEHVRNALDRYDPDHSAMVVGTFLHELAEVAGRRSLAYRRPEWLSLDDKTVIDSVWDKIGITRESSEIVAVEPDSIRTAAKRLDKGDGVVLSGDSRDGVGGGATGVRWVHTDPDFGNALEYFQQHCDQVRVMPFLEGIPCSIHGIVFPDYVAALRPVEMIVLRKSNSHEFFYAGTATFWDPEPRDREAMRTVAKKVGNALRDTVHYRGIFTVDGVLTKDGFRPTELNPRSGAGIKPVLSGISDLPLELLAQALVAGAGLRYKPEELEALILSASDKQRGGGSWKAIPAHLPQIDRRPIKHSDLGWEWAEAEDPGDGTVMIGPGPLGSFVRLTPNSSSVKTGSSFAPLARDFWRFIDEDMNGGIGPLETAQSVR